MENKTPAKEKIRLTTFGWMRSYTEKERVYAPSLKRLL